MTGADRAAEIETVDPVEVIAMLPAVVVSEAPLLDIAADPESEMSPRALIAPVGATDVPPLMVTAPLVAVRVPAPE